jgi:hypothetical protein
LCKTYAGGVHQDLHVSGTPPGMKKDIFRRESGAKMIEGGAGTYPSRQRGCAAELRGHETVKGRRKRPHPYIDVTEEAIGFVYCLLAGVSAASIKAGSISFVSA